MTKRENVMATATEGYVEARADAVRAKAETSIAQALLRVERSITIQTRWILGLMVGMFTALVAIGVSIALTVANP